MCPVLDQVSFKFAEDSNNQLESVFLNALKPSLSVSLSRLAKVIPASSTPRGGNFIMCLGKNQNEIWLPRKIFESAALLHFSARPTSASLPWTPPVPLFQADCFIVSEAPVSVFACMCSQFLNQYVSGVLELCEVAVCGPGDT